ncbi:MAG: twin-arginine translocase TatA/TatE family subunit [Acidimicrobiales bacterium]
MPNLPGPTELIIILLIVMLIFGGAKLPKLARSLGEAKTEFEKSAKKDPKAEATKAALNDDDDKVTLSKSELDALLIERELKAKRD